MSAKSKLVPIKIYMCITSIRTPGVEPGSPPAVDGKAHGKRVYAVHHVRGDMVDVHPTNFLSAPLIFCNLVSDMSTNDSDSDIIDRLRNSYWSHLMADLACANGWLVARMADEPKARCISQNDPQPCQNTNSIKMNIFLPPISQSRPEIFKV
ncbi:hypothetical protein C8R44DRAFT_724642 [Mycena epipterygia]|nr:hypothetical protein C8R44DRAFT_724642 [Mycena epipterygia]